MKVIFTLPAVAAGLLLIPGVALAKLNVVVSSKPIHALVASVMAGVGSPGLLVDGPASPHTFAMKPSDARRVHNATVFFRASEQLEPFTGKLVKSLPSSVRVVSLAEAPGLMFLERREGGAFEDHDPAGHAHGPEADRSHDNAHETSAHAKHDDNPEHAHDPHVWLDPENAKAMVRHIADVLVGLAPEKADAIKANAAAEVDRITLLSQQLAEELRPITGKPFIVYHDAQQYLEKRFGLSAVGSVTVSPDIPPSGKRLQELRAKITSSGAVCVFAEPYSDPRLLKVVVEGTGVRTGTLDPEGIALTPGPNLYAKLMRDLAKNLKACLAGE